MLARVFENLLTNAVRYGYDGQFVDLNGYIDNGEVVVQVMNYGDSIPAEDLPYLLICFIQVINRELRTVAGQALDRLLRKILLSKDNGTISAESNVVRTMFEVRLPKDENLTI